jgi:uncharacterized damage-inducible protein DinB
MMEPWLTGEITDLHPIQAALLYSFQQATQDLRQWTEGLTDEQIWRRNGKVAPVGFHIRHIAGSVDRLMTYAMGKQMDDRQMQALKQEQSESGPGREELLGALEDQFFRSAEVVRSIDVAALTEIREIGRKRIPVPLGVLLVHISEHTQRHVGEAIVTTKTVR